MAIPIVLRIQKEMSAVLSQKQEILFVEICISQVCVRMQNRYHIFRQISLIAVHMYVFCCFKYVLMLTSSCMIKSKQNDVINILWEKDIT